MFQTEFKSDFELPEVMREVRLKLACYDASALESFSILGMDETAGYYGICDTPYDRLSERLALISGYNIRCGINRHIEYPISVTANTVVTDTLMSGNHPGGTIVKDLAEVSIWLAGATTYDYLSYIGTFRNQEPTREAFAVDWLNQWRVVH